MSRFQPRKASRQQLKARIAITGPSGAGKTYTAIEFAQTLQGDGRTVVIDSERGSASWYSDRWDYDVVDWAPPYDPRQLAEAIAEASATYSVIVIDSLSHFWEGEGGTQDIADNAGHTSGGGNRFAGWKVATPALRHLIDTILACPAHVICTMRSKMEYVLEDNDRGKKQPRKVGMAPVMRNGVEYEFTLICDMDLAHRMVVSKSRCAELADQVYQSGRTDEAAKAFLAWLEDGEPLADPEDVKALVASMNDIEDETVRKRVKREFQQQFGPPTQLAESRMAAAVEFVKGAA